MFKSVGRVWRILAAVLVVTAGALGFVSPALAGAASYTLPEHFNVDRLGINIGTLLYERRDTLISIGDPANGGLSWTFQSHLGTDPYDGVISYWGPPAAGSHLWQVKIAGAQTTFVGCESGICQNGSGTQATLALSGSNWLYTGEDGTVYTFSATGSYTSENSFQPVVFIGHLLSIHKPNGALLTINYSGSTELIQSVVSNRGYALKYEWNGSGGDGRSKISAINLSNHVCDATITTCDGVDSYITFSYFNVTSAGNGLTYAVEQITDPAGNNWQYAVNPISMPGDARNPVDYTDPDALMYFKSPNGYEASLIYDTAGRLSTFTDSRGTWTYKYPDETLRLAQNGSSTHTIKVTDPSGALYYTAHSGSQLVDYVQDPLGNTTNYTFTGGQINYYQGGFIYGTANYTRLSSLSLPEGNSQTWGYDSRGNINQVTNTPKSGSGLSATVIYANYDSTCSNPVKCNKPNWTEDAKGNYTYYSYDPTHGGVTLVQSPADSNGVTPQTATTWAQYTAQVKTASGMANAGTIWLPQTVSTCASAATCNGSANQAITTTAYNTYNLLPSAVTTAAGDNSISATTGFTYDAVGNKTSVDGPRTDVNDISYTIYDSDRRPIYEIGVDPDGSGSLPRLVTHHAYTGMLETQTETGTSQNTDGSGFNRASYVTTSYNAMGQKTLTAAYIDGNSSAQNLSQFNYDVRGRSNCSVVRMNPAVYSSIGGTDACALGAAGSYGPDRITKNTYDAGDQLTEVDQAYGVTTANGFAQTLQRAYARYSYNANGTRATEMDANGNKTAYIYDGFDRLSQIQYPSTTVGSGAANTADYEQFQYDANSNKTVWRRRNGKAFYYNYDNLNREILHYVSDGSVQNVYTGYDLADHVVYARYGSTTGAGITNRYDGLGRLISSIDYNSREIRQDYNQASARAWLSWPDGNYVQYYRDSLDRIATMGFDAPTGLISPGYDNLGRRTWLPRRPDPSGNLAGASSFAFDNLGRLTAMNNDLAGAGSDINWTFAYNPAGQIASTAASSTAYDYKETANVTVAKTFDGLNRDQTIAVLGNGYDANGNLTNDGTRLFYYDAYNRLTGVGSSAYPQNGPYLTFVYDPLGRLASQTYYGTTTSFLYDGTNLIAEYDANGNVAERYIHGEGVDEPLVWFHGSGTSDERFFIQDYHGSVIGYTDASGNLQALYKYGPYGEPKDISNGTNFAGARFRYTGQMVLPEAQLYYYKARVYDPVMGHFLQIDPIGSSADLDLYAYTGNDPVNFSDPDGNYPFSDATTSAPSDSNCALTDVDCSPVVTVKLCDKTCQAANDMASRMAFHDIFTSDSIGRPRMPPAPPLRPAREDCDDPDYRGNECRLHHNWQTCPRGWICRYVTDHDTQEAVREYKNCVARVDQNLENTDNVVDGAAAWFGGAGDNTKRVIRKVLVKREQEIQRQCGDDPS